MAGARLCSNCGSSGHNRRTCKNPAKTPAVREVAPIRNIPVFVPEKVEQIKQVETHEFVGDLPKVNMAPCLAWIAGKRYVCGGSVRVEVPNDTTFEQISNYVSWR